VLTALNIADEYHLLKRGRDDNRERREAHYTKRWYEQELLGIAEDESLSTKERHEALFNLGKSRGYHYGRRRRHSA